MLIYRVKPKDAEAFRRLDPFRFLERLALPNHFALTACEEPYTEGGQATAAGLLLGRMDPGALVIEWICVFPEYRDSGVGDLLLSRCFDIAETEGALPLAVELFHERGVIEPESASIPYFDSWQFSDEEPGYGEWEMDIRMLFRSAFFRQDRKEFPEAVPLAALRSTERETVIASLGGKEEAERLYDILSFPAEYDYGISTALMDGSVPVGLFLAIRSGETCYPVFCHAESEREKTALLLAAGEGLRREMRTGGYIRVIPLTEKTADFMQRHFPRGKIKTGMMIYR